MIWIDRLAFLVTDLNNKKIIDFDLDSLYELDLLIIESVDLITDYDLLSGLLGIGNYFIHRYKLVPANQKNLYISWIRKIADKLFRISIKKNKKIYWETFTITTSGEVINNIIDFGAAHGLPSILNFYAKVIELNRNDCDNYIKIVDSIYNQLNDNIIYDDGAYYLPNYLNLNTSHKPMNKRLSWCYGNLGAAVQLNNASNILQNEEISLLTMKLLSVFTKVDYNLDSNNSDNCLCHGLSGNLFLLNILEKTNENMNDDVNTYKDKMKLALRHNIYSSNFIINSQLYSFGI